MSDNIDRDEIITKVIQLNGVAPRYAAAARQNLMEYTDAELANELKRLEDNKGTYDKCWRNSISSPVQPMQHKP